MNARDERVEVMDINIIEQLIKDMDNSSLTKLEIEQDGVRICMEKGNPCMQQWMDSKEGHERMIVQNLYANEEDGHTSSVQPMSSVNPVTDAKEELVHAQEVSVSYSYITSPMVGTFYEAAGPDQSPYVKVGDYVKKGQTICIIESMKLMNEIEADVEGEVVAILVSDKNMVEYGQKMFEILPR